VVGRGLPPPKVRNKHQPQRLPARQVPRLSRVRQPHNLGRKIRPGQLLEGAGEDGTGAVGDEEVVQQTNLRPW